MAYRFHLAFFLGLDACAVMPPVMPKAAGLPPMQGMPAKAAAELEWGTAGQ